VKLPDPKDLTPCLVDDLKRRIIIILAQQLVLAKQLHFRRYLWRPGKDPRFTPDIEWTTCPEMEIGLSYRTGLSYRIAPKWFIGAEIVYDTEFETEVGL